jgi:hypothetical protein
MAAAAAVSAQGKQMKCEMAQQAAPEPKKKSQAQNIASLAVQLSHKELTCVSKTNTEPWETKQPCCKACAVKYGWRHHPNTSRYRSAAQQLQVQGAKKRLKREFDGIAIDCSNQVR